MWSWTLSPPTFKLSYNIVCFALLVNWRMVPLLNHSSAFYNGSVFITKKNINVALYQPVWGTKQYLQTEKCINIIGSPWTLYGEDVFYYRQGMLTSPILPFNIFLRYGMSTWSFWFLRLKLISFVYCFHWGNLFSIFSFGRYIYIYGVPGIGLKAFLARIIKSKPDISSTFLKLTHSIETTFTQKNFILHNVKYL